MNGHAHVDDALQDQRPDPQERAAGCSYPRWGLRHQTPREKEEGQLPLFNWLFGSHSSDRYPNR